MRECQNKTADHKKNFHPFKTVQQKVVQITLTYIVFIITFIYKKNIYMIKNYQRYSQESQTINLWNIVTRRGFPLQFAVNGI
jgi:hypothetical protein